MILFLFIEITAIINSDRMLFFINMDVFELHVVCRNEAPFLQVLLEYSEQPVLQNQLLVLEVLQLSHDFHHLPTEN